MPTRQTILSAVIGVALSTGTAVRADDPVKFAPTPIPMPTEPMKVEPPKAEPTKVDATAKEVESLKLELAAVKKLVDALDTTVYGRKDGQVIYPQDKGHRKLLEDLTASMKSLDTRLKTMEEKLAKTTVGSSPLPTTTVPPTGVPIVGKSTLKLVNEYNVPISLVVNGVSHPLEPQQSKDLEIPSGSFSYELIGTAEAKRTSSIKEGETVTLRIR